MKLQFSHVANTDIDRLYAFLIENQASKKTADTALLKIKKGLQSLINNPALGVNMNDGTNRQELYIHFGKGTYVLRYIADDETDTIYVLRIWHSKEIRV